MSLHNAGVIAGAVSTTLFVGSYLPMLVKAARTRDLSSYSVSSLAVANIGNAVHTIYVVSLPVGPIWALHGFYLASTAVMMWWWLRYRNRASHADHAALTPWSSPETSVGHFRSGSARRCPTTLSLAKGDEGFG